MCDPFANLGFENTLTIAKCFQFIRVSLYSLDLSIKNSMSHSSSTSFPKLFVFVTYIVR